MTGAISLFTPALTRARQSVVRGTAQHNAPEKAPVHAAPISSDVIHMYFQKYFNQRFSTAVKIH